MAVWSNFSGMITVLPKSTFPGFPLIIFLPCPAGYKLNRIWDCISFSIILNQITCDVNSRQQLKTEGNISYLQQINVFAPLKICKWGYSSVFVAFSLSTWVVTMVGLTRFRDKGGNLHLGFLLPFPEGGNRCNLFETIFLSIQLTFLQVVSTIGLRF